MAQQRRRSILEALEAGGTCDLTAVTVTPTAEGGTVTPPSGYDGFSSVVLPSEPNLTAGNIRAGVSIFGVSGNIDVGSTFDIGAFFARTMTSLEITFGTLADYCCYNYTGLTSITAPNLTTIGNYAFNGCTGLTTLSLPALTNIGNYAFNGCTGLTTVSLPNVLSLGSYAFQNCTAMTTFTAANLTTVGAYAFNECTSLRTIDLSTIRSVGSHAFYDCKYVASSGQTITLSSDVGEYAFYYFSYNNRGSGYDVVFSERVNIGAYAFSYTDPKSFTGEIGNIGNYGMFCWNSSDGKTTIFNGSIHGSIGANGFSLRCLSNVDFSTSVITSLGSSAFQNLGYYRENYSTVRATYDFRNSTFTTVPGYCFYYTRYADIYLPSTVTTIQGYYPLGYTTNDYIYFTNTSVPTLSTTQLFVSSTGCKLCIPYKIYNAWRTATNWSSYTSYMVGYAAEDTWAAGTTLPEYNPEGYGLTWYSDIACTTAITTVPSGSPAVYAVVSATQGKMVITVDAQFDAVISVYDNTTSTQLDFTDGYALVDSGDSLDITVTAPTGYTIVCDVDGTSVTSFPYTITATADVSISAYSYDASRINPDFATATWQELKNAVDDGYARFLYADNVGDTKTITLTDDTTFTFRLADTTGTLYQYSDESGYAGLIFDCTTCYTRSIWSSAQQNTGPLGNVNPVGTTILPAIEALLPSDLTDVIATVKVISAQSGTSGTLVSSDMAVFIPAYKEIFGSQGTSRSEEAAVLTWWEYYSTHNANSYRIKQYNGSNFVWWLRSPSTCSSTNNFETVVASNGVGDRVQIYSGNTYGVSVTFCI